MILKKVLTILLIAVNTMLLGQTESLIEYSSNTSLNDPFLVKWQEDTLELKATLQVYNSLVNRPYDGHFGTDVLLKVSNLLIDTLDTASFNYVHDKLISYGSGQYAGTGRIDRSNYQTSSGVLISSPCAKRVVGIYDINNAVGFAFQDTICERFRNLEFFNRDNEFHSVYRSQSNDVFYEILDSDLTPEAKYNLGPDVKATSFDEKNNILYCFSVIAGDSLDRKIQSLDGEGNFTTINSQLELDMEFDRFEVNDSLILHFSAFKSRDEIRVVAYNFTGDKLGEYIFESDGSDLLRSGQLSFTEDGELLIAINNNTYGSTNPVVIYHLSDSLALIGIGNFGYESVTVTGLELRKNGDFVAVGSTQKQYADSSIRESDKLWILEANLTDLEDAQSNFVELIVVPNPIDSNVLRIKSNKKIETDGLQVSIFDVSGRRFQIEELNRDKNDLIIKTSNLDPGNYFVVLKSLSGQSTVQFRVNN